MTELTTDDDLGGCPTCGKINPIHKNIGRVRYYYCPDHKKYWDYGSNRFDDWRMATESDWQSNREFFSTYELVVREYRSSFDDLNDAATKAGEALATLSASFPSQSFTVHVVGCEEYPCCGRRADPPVLTVIACDGAYTFANPFDKGH